MLQELKIKIRSAYLCDSKMLNVAAYVTKTATIIFLLVVFNFDFCASGAVLCIAHGSLMSFSCTPHETSVLLAVTKLWVFSVSK